MSWDNWHWDDAARHVVKLDIEEIKKELERYRHITRDKPMGFGRRFVWDKDSQKLKEVIADRHLCYGGATQGGKSDIMNIVKEFWEKSKMVTNWYDGLSENQIQVLKDNVVPLCHCKDFKQRVFKAMPVDVLELWNETFCEWRPVIATTRVMGRIYRLKPGWKRPEAKKPEQAEKLVSYDVIQSDRCWLVDLKNLAACGGKPMLSSAQDFQGYCGIEYAEVPGRIFGSRPTAYRYIRPGIHSCSEVFVICAEGKIPADAVVVALTPVRVWFREVV